MQGAVCWSCSLVSGERGYWPGLPGILFVLLALMKPLKMHILTGRRGVDGGGGQL